MRFSRLSFRVIPVLVSVSSLAVCASAQSKASLRGAVVVSEDLVSAVPLEVSAVKQQVTPIPTWTFLRRHDASSAAAITSKQFEP
jgi:hypothetical protein